MREFLTLKNMKYKKQLEWLLGAVLIVFLNSIQVYAQIQARYTLHKIGTFLFFSFVLHVIQWHYGMEYIKHEVVKKKGVIKVCFYIFSSNVLSYVLLFTGRIQWFIPLGLLGGLALYILLRKELGYSVLFYHISIILLLGEKLLDIVTIIFLIVITLLVTSIYWNSLLYGKHRMYMGITLYSIYITAFVIHERFLLHEIGQAVLIYGIATILYITVLHYLHRLGYQVSKDIEEEAFVKVVDRATHNKLLHVLKGISKEEFYFARLVSNISSKAAKSIQMDTTAVKFGGLYHGVGKSKQGNYINNSIQILREEGFCEEVIEVVKNHNLNYGKPETKSSFIVMVTISIIYTLSRLDIISKEHHYTMYHPKSNLHNEHSNKKYKYSDEYLKMVVEQVIELRMKRSMMKQSILTDYEIMRLKKFYTEDMILLLVLNGKEDI